MPWQFILSTGEINMLLSVKERGQGMVEYALILVLVAVVAIVALTVLGPLVSDLIDTVSNNF
jgi:pilus assembly protein Flp/PilA